jgi:phage gp29-like protein
MATKKKSTEDAGPEVQEVQTGPEETAGETMDVLVISLGAVGEPKAETLSRVVQAALGKIRVEEAAAQLQALYADLPLKEQRAFVRDADFIIGRLTSVVKLMPERFAVK